MRHLEVGDLVHWQFMGHYVYINPKKVVKIIRNKDDNDFVYIEGLSKAIPIGQIVKVNKN